MILPSLYSSCFGTSENWSCLLEMKLSEDCQLKSETPRKHPSFVSLCVLNSVLLLLLPLRATQRGSGGRQFHGVVPAG